MPLFLRALNHSAVPNTLIFNSLATKGANIMDEKIAKLKEWIDASDNIVFFGGAGVSTESGIPDFARWTVYTTSSTSTRRRPFSATRSF